MPPRFAFLGHPHYLGLAATALGLSTAAMDEARRLPSLTRLANLVAQAGDADPAHAPGILAEAMKSHDALALAASASESILIHAHEALALPAPAFATTEEKAGWLDGLASMASLRVENAALESKLAAETLRADELDDALTAIQDAATAPPPAPAPGDAPSPAPAPESKLAAETLRADKPDAATAPAGGAPGAAKPPAPAKT